MDQVNLLISCYFSSSMQPCLSLLFPLAIRWNSMISLKNPSLFDKEIGRRQIMTGYTRIQNDKILCWRAVDGLLVRAKHLKLLFLLCRAIIAIFTIRDHQAAERRDVLVIQSLRPDFVRCPMQSSGFDLNDCSPQFKLLRFPLITSVRLLFYVAGAILFHLAFAIFWLFKHRSTKFYWLLFSALLLQLEIASQRDPSFASNLRSASEFCPSCK